MTPRSLPLLRAEGNTRVMRAIGDTHAAKVMVLGGVLDAMLTGNLLLLLRSEEKWNTLVSWANLCYLKIGFLKKKR